MNDRLIPHTETTQTTEAINPERRATLVRLAALPLLASPACLWANDKAPAAPVNLVVPFAPGGTSDIIARVLAEAAQRQTGGVFVVENRAGGAGAIGVQAIAKAAPDGRSLLLGNIATQTIAPHLYRRTGYPTLKDFRPLTLTGRTTNVVVVHPSSGIEDFKALDARLRASGEAHVYASGSNGGSPHLSFELLKQRLGWQCEHVPYKGAGPMMTDLLGGHVKIAIDNLPTMLPLIKRGDVRAIAITSARRWPEAENIPTFSELGVQDYDVNSWFGVFAPRDLPDVAAQRLAAIFRTAQEDAAAREKLTGLGARIDPITLDEFARFVEAESQRWSEVITRANIRVE